MCMFLYANNAFAQQPEVSLNSIYNSSEQFYQLLQKRENLLLKITNLEKQLRPKHTLSLGRIIATGLLSAIAAGPALTMNYLNQHITPENYQSFINKTSLGLAAIPLTLGALSLTKQTALSTYDMIRYEKNQQAIKDQMKNVRTEIEQVTNDIKTFAHNHPEMNLVRWDYNRDTLYQEFLQFYAKNSFTLNKNQLTPLLFNNQSYSIDYILTMLKTKKIELINKYYNLEPTVGGGFPFFRDTGNIGGDVAAAVIFFPWALLFNAVSKPGTRNPDIDKIKLEIENVSKIIKQLE
jgi:hypothetical protein